MFANLKLYAIAAAALAICFLVWREHHAVQRAKSLSAELSQTQATLTAEREGRKHERELNAKIDQQLLDAQKALDLERAKPLPHLQCRRVPVSTSSVPSPATAPPVDPTGTQGHDGQADAGDTEFFDPSAELMQFAVDAEENLNSLKACQAWVKAR